MARLARMQQNAQEMDKVRSERLDHADASERERERLDALRRERTSRDGLGGVFIRYALLCLRAAMQHMHSRSAAQKSFTTLPAIA